MKNIFCCLAALSAALLAGCSNTARFNYSAAPGSMVALMPLAGEPTVGVLPAEDLRDAAAYADYDNADENTGSYYLGMIPLFPFGWRTMRHPDQNRGFATLSQFDFQPGEDLAESAALSLRASRLFAKVVRVRDVKSSNCTYLWRTKLRDTRYRGYLVTYGITYIGAPVLWLLGLPDGVSCGDLGVDFQLIERASGRVVWKQSHDLSDSIWHWMYARVGADADIYARMLKYALGKSMVSLSEALATAK